MLAVRWEGAKDWSWGQKALCRLLGKGGCDSRLWTLSGVCLIVGGENITLCRSCQGNVIFMNWLSIDFARDFRHIEPMKGEIELLIGVLILASGVVAGQAQSAYSTNADGSIYRYNTNTDGSINIVDYSGPPWAVTIPTHINGANVTSIGPGAFDSLPLTRVMIPGGITRIGEAAFGTCTNLVSITIGNGVTSIGQVAFLDCYSLPSVTIPGSITNLGEFAFENCYALTNLTLCNGVSSLGDYVFSACHSLTRVTIPGSITNIGAFAFDECLSLTNAFFKSNAPTAVSVFNSSASSDKDPVTIYYLPGATGWADFAAHIQGNLPVVLWNPLIQTGDGSFSVRNSQFGFNITSTYNLPVEIEVCTNLSNPVWTPVQTLTITNGSVYFSEPFHANAPVRFYALGFP